MLAIPSHITLLVFLLSKLLCLMSLSCACSLVPTYPLGSAYILRQMRALRSCMGPLRRTLHVEGYGFQNYIALQKAIEQVFFVIVDEIGSQKANCLACVKTSRSFFYDFSSRKSENMQKKVPVQYYNNLVVQHLPLRMNTAAVDLLEVYLRT